jgi:putative addiction module component (TIGR02574 family)
MKTDDVIAEALKLPPELKSKLAEQLLDSLQVEQAEIDAAWLDEARRRLQEIEDGQVQTIPAEEVFRSLDARLKP